MAEYEVYVGRGDDTQKVGTLTDGELQLGNEILRRTGMHYVIKMVPDRKERDKEDSSNRI